MDCSTPGFPVLHCLPEFAQTHVHWVSDAIQPSHPLLPPSPPVLNLSQHQGFFPMSRLFASGGQSIAERGGIATEATLEAPFFRPLLRGGWGYSVINTVLYMIAVPGLRALSILIMVPSLPIRGAARQLSQIISLPLNLDCPFWVSVMLLQYEVRFLISFPWLYIWFWDGRDVFNTASLKNRRWSRVVGITVCAHASKTRKWGLGEDLTWSSGDHISKSRTFSCAPTYKSQHCSLQWELKTSSSQSKLIIFTSCLPHSPVLLMRTTDHH